MSNALFALVFGVVAGLLWFALHYLSVVLIRVVGVLLAFAGERVHTLIHHWLGAS